MPELPEVESRRQFAHLHLQGRTLVAVRVAPDPIVCDEASPHAVARALRGRRVLATGRLGKQMWLELDRAPWPLLHFGMGGDFHAYREASERPSYWKLEVETDDGLRLAMTNPRRIGRIRLMKSPDQCPHLTRLGPDPYLNLPAPAEFASRIGRRRAPIKAVLLDQTVLAGVGNWIADEVLYQARLDPRRGADSLSRAELNRVRGVLKRVLHKAVSVHADDTRFPRSWLFHVRWGRVAGARTAKGEVLEYATVGGRTTAWVPSVQR